MEIQLSVQGVLADPATESHIVLLQDESRSRTLPIWVGMSEGNAIRVAVEGAGATRPLTHDLLCKLLDRLKTSVKKIVVHDLRDNTFYAAIYLETEGREVTLDARPSDAIAIALRTSAPIFVRQELLAASEAERIQAWLDDLKPADFETR
ncbi:MAG: bifunctional nuclease family protein [Nitrospiria bacterium]